MSLLRDAAYAEILEAEQRLSTYEHKARKVLNFFRLEIVRAYESQPATKELYERLGVMRLMALRLAELMLKRTGTASVISNENRRLARLLLSADRLFAVATVELSREYGNLDFSHDLAERIAAEFGTDSGDAWRDAQEIRAHRRYVLAHGEEIVAKAKAAGLL